MLGEVAELLTEVLDELGDPASPLSARTREAIGPASEHVGHRLYEILQGIESGDFDERLRDHGLEDGDAEFAFKNALFDDALRFYRAQQETSEEPYHSSPWYRRWAKLVRYPLRAGNVVLRSVGFIPGAGALAELKDAAEVVADFLAD